MRGPRCDSNAPGQPTGFVAEKVVRKYKKAHHGDKIRSAGPEPYPVLDQLSAYTN